MGKPNSSWVEPVMVLMVPSIKGSPNSYQYSEHKDGQYQFDCFYSDSSYPTFIRLILKGDFYVDMT